MPVIKLVTEIGAPVTRCFDLARSIDFHVKTAASTKEEAIAGRTSGLINLNEVVTFRARHFGIVQQLTSKITDYTYPQRFTDEMQKGAFKSLKHIHLFHEKGSLTIMEDIFTYEAPYGIIGYLFEKAVLHTYMHQFLVTRNTLLKKALENEDWKNYLINTV
jgi:ligand-binding SRPBCC domain-containing protein